MGGLFKLCLLYMSSPRRTIPNCSTKLIAVKTIPHCSTVIFEVIFSRGPPRWSRHWRKSWDLFSLENMLLGHLIVEMTKRMESSMGGEENGQKLKQGKVRVDIKSFYIVRIDKHWNRFIREVFWWFSRPDCMSNLVRSHSWPCCKPEETGLYQIQILSNLNYSMIFLSSSCFLLLMILVCSWSLSGFTHFFLITFSQLFFSYFFEVRDTGK